ncbi:MAG: hypothetical protein ACU0DW_04065 [Shimia sp.]
MDRAHHTSFMASLIDRVAERGGLFNAHLHIDRAETLEHTIELLAQEGRSDVSAIGLMQKHWLIPAIHNSPCYDSPALRDRVKGCLLRMAQLGTRRAHSVVDVTADRVGLTALDTLLDLRREMSPTIDFHVGAYNPLGFRDDAPDRWALLARGAEKAHFIGGLPERDDTADYPDHIGFEASCQRLIRLSHELEKPLHLHVDQKNLPTEAQTEAVIDIVRRDGLIPAAPEPLIWLIHVISPSTYEEDRFLAMAKALAKLNIGVICCPLAALSMRQIRPVTGPTHNSIARVLDLLAAGVHVRLGSDNVCDITSPLGTLDLMDEVIAIAHAERFYDADVLTHLATGEKLPSDLRDRVATHLADNRRACRSASGAP